MESLAWSEFAGMRGDLFIQSSGRSRAKNNGISREEFVAAQETAKKIYADLSYKREQKGLAPFDDSYPTYHDDLYKPLMLESIYGTLEP